MLEFAEKHTVREPLKAKPRPDIDRKALRASLSKRYSASLAYLGR